MTKFLKLSIIFSVFLGGSAGLFPLSFSNLQALDIVVIQSGKERVLSHLGASEGSLFEIVEKALEKLDSLEKASIDLVLLEASQAGVGHIPKRAYVPRWALKKFNLKIKIRPGGAVESFLSEAYRKKALAEGVPVETYLIQSLGRIVLTNSKSVFARKYFLDRRTDPILVRGEKRFLQTCMGCHGNGTESLEFPQALSPWKEASGNLVFQSKHPKTTQMPNLDDAELRAVQKYLEAVEKNR